MQATRNDLPGLLHSLQQHLKKCVRHHAQRTPGNLQLLLRILFFIDQLQLNPLSSSAKTSFVFSFVISGCKGKNVAKPDFSHSAVHYPNHTATTSSSWLSYPSTKPSHQSKLTKVSEQCNMLLTAPALDCCTLCNAPAEFIMFRANTFLRSAHKAAACRSTYFAGYGPPAYESCWTLQRQNMANCHP